MASKRLLARQNNIEALNRSNACRRFAIEARAAACVVCRIPFGAVEVADGLVPAVMPETLALCDPQTSPGGVRTERWHHLRVSWEMSNNPAAFVARA